MPKWVPLGVDVSLIRVWEDTAVAFNRLSGQTHLLNPLAAEALFLIAEEPLSTDELAQSLADIIGEQLSAEWRGQLDEFVAELSELGLIADASE